MIGFPLDSHVTFDTDGTPIYDRAITSDPYRKLLKTLFTNGILPDVSTNLQVTAKEGLTLNVLSGFAMVEGCMKWQEKDLTVTLDPGDSLSRIDRVVMRLNVNDDVRDCELAIIKGTPATSPIAPDPVRSSSVYDICLAAITVNSNTQEITNSNINDTRYDSNVCGVISSLSEFDTTTLYNQIQSDLREFKEINEQDFANWTDYEKNLWQSWVSTNEADFLAWYDRMKGQLSQDAAGHLQLQIDALNSDINALEAEMPFAGGSKVNINFEYNVVPNIQYSNEHYKLTVGDTVRENNFSSSKLHFDEYGILTVGDGVLEVTYDVTDSRTGKITHVSYTYTINMPYFGRFAYNVTISASLYNYQGWLESIGKDASSYPTIEDVFADEKLLRELMTRHASVDYLVEWLANNNEDAHTVLNNDYCAKWINLRDYALDMLYANPTVKAVMDEVDKYGYGEWALVNAIPKMTSNTDSNGIASSSGSDNTSYAPWHAFDRNDDTVFATNIDTPRERFYLRYSFVEATKITAAEIRATSYNATYYYNIKIQASNDGNTWEDISNDLQIKEAGTKGTEVLKFEIIHSDYYKHYQIICSSTNAASMYVNLVAALFINDVNFYTWGPKGNVPVMTSNTAPYGNVFVSNAASGYDAWHVFDGTNATSWSTAPANNAYIGYSFTNPICIHRFRIITKEAKVFKVKLQASNDSISWVDISSEVSTPLSSLIVSNNNYYKYYRLYCTDTNGTYNTDQIQFYGRSLNVSVPTMTSNTAPWGEASMHADQGSPNSSYPAWKAFDKVSNLALWNGNDKTGSGTINNNAYIRYRFSNTIVPRMFGFSWGDESKPNYIFTVKVQGSNDGILWEDLSSDIEQSMATNMKYYVLSNANNAYKYMQLLYIAYDMPSSIACPQASEIQFYGLDYSEREFEEGSTMKYLYDHGVELEPIDGFSTNSNSAFYTKESNQLYVNKTVFNSISLFNTANGIDISPYKLLRGIAGDKFAYDGGNVDISIRPAHNDVSQAISQNNLSLNFNELPNNIFLDISSINSVAYPVMTTNDGGTVNSMSLTEWWLE